MTVRTIHQASISGDIPPEYGLKNIKKGSNVQYPHLLDPEDLPLKYGKSPGHHDSLFKPATRFTQKNDAEVSSSPPACFFLLRLTCLPRCPTRTVTTFCWDLLGMKTMA